VTHHCAADRFCKAKTQLSDGRKAGAFIGVERGLCEYCVRAVVSALRGIPADLVILGAAAEQSHQAGDVFVHATPVPTIPLNTTVIALSSTLSDYCGAGVAMVAHKLRIDPVARQKAPGYPVHEVPVIAQAARVLPDNVDLLLKAKPQPIMLWDREGEHWDIAEIDGITVALRLVRIHATIQHLGSPVKRQRLSMPCPLIDCGAVTLGINEGDDHVTCMNCGSIWTRDQYDRLAYILIEDHKHTEAQMELLKYLLAESRYKEGYLAWLNAEKEHRLSGIWRLASLTETDLAQIENLQPYNIVLLLREQMTP